MRTRLCTTIGLLLFLALGVGARFTVSNGLATIQPSILQASGPAALAGQARDAAPPSSQPGAALPATSGQLPNAANSLKFAVLGDFGTGSQVQYQTAAQMAKTHTTFPFDMVLLVGDNLYGGQRPQDFQRKFEIPYKPLIDAGVKFYASLGNHDIREQRYYKLFNMDGKLYYSFKAPRQRVRFFALETSYMVPDQVKWIESELQSSNDDWKIVYFHHPLYSSARAHGSDLGLRVTLEPLFIRFGVSVVLAGHDHVYERIKPQNNIVHFVAGSGGQLRRGNLRTNTGLTARGFDTDTVFMVAEIVDDTMYFNAVSRMGQIVDSGSITRRETPR